MSNKENEERRNKKEDKEIQQHQQHQQRPRLWMYPLRKEGGGAMKFCDCDNCRHQECCGGPQYGCVPDYYPEHFGAGENQTD